MAHKGPKLIWVLFYTFGCFIWITFGSFMVYESGGSGWKGMVGGLFVAWNVLMLGLHWFDFFRKKRRVLNDETG